MGLIRGKTKGKALDRKSYVVEDEDKKVISAYSMSDGNDVSVVYYRQLVGENSVSRPFDINLTKVEQQYSVIDNLSVKIRDIDDEYKGTMIVIPDIQPNKNDVFIMKMFDGKYGLFTITDVNVKDYNLNSVYECEFALLSFDTSYLDAVKSKVSISLKYDNDALYNNSRPIITSNEYQDRQEAKKLIQKLQTSFMQFYNDTNNRYELKHSGKRYYDNEASAAFNYYTSRESVGVEYLPPDEFGMKGFLKSIILDNTISTDVKKGSILAVNPILPSGRYGNYADLLGATILDYNEGYAVTLEYDSNNVFPNTIINENTYLYSKDDEESVLSIVLDTMVKDNALRYNHIKDMANEILKSPVLGYFYTGLVLHMLNYYLQDRGV